MFYMTPIVSPQCALTDLILLNLWVNTFKLNSVDRPSVIMISQLVGGVLINIIQFTNHEEDPLEMIVNSKPPVSYYLSQNMEQYRSIDLIVITVQFLWKVIFDVNCAKSFYFTKVYICSFIDTLLVKFHYFQSKDFLILMYC